MSDRKCIEDGCPDEVGRKGGRGRCSRHLKAYLRHYKRLGIKPPPSPKAQRTAEMGRAVERRRPARTPRYCIDCDSEVDYSGARGRCNSCYYRWRKWFQDRGLPLPPRYQNVDARYPSREQLLAMMEDAGSLAKLAAAVGVHVASLYSYLQRRPDLHGELVALTRPMRGVPRNPNSGKRWKSQAISPNRTRLNGGYFAYDPLARDYVDVLRGDPCSYCGQPTTTIDHIEPLSRGGGDDWENLTGACQRCNSSKHTKPMLGWMLETLDARSRRMPTAAVFSSWAEEPSA